MTGVGIQAKFSKETKQWDGLGPYADQLVNDPMQTLVIVAVAEVSRITDLPHEGVKQPTIRITHLELCVEGDDSLRATNLLQKLYAARTGREDGSQPSLFDDDGQDPAPGMEEFTHTEADPEDHQDQVNASVTDDGEAWPGDVEFQAPPPNVEDDSTSTTPERKRRGRKPVDGTDGS